jgi:hypothetical protein
LILLGKAEMKQIQFLIQETVTTSALTKRFSPPPPKSGVLLSQFFFSDTGMWVSAIVGIGSGHEASVQTFTTQEMINDTCFTMTMSGSKCGDVNWDLDNIELRHQVIGCMLSCKTESEHLAIVVSEHRKKFLVVVCVNLLLQSDFIGTEQTWTGNGCVLLLLFVLMLLWIVIPKRGKTFFKTHIQILNICFKFLSLGWILMMLMDATVTIICFRLRGKKVSCFSLTRCSRLQESRSGCCKTRHVHNGWSRGWLRERRSLTYMCMFVCSERRGVKFYSCVCCCCVVVVVMKKGCSSRSLQMSMG